MRAPSPSDRPFAFLLGYVRRRKGLFSVVFLAVISAAACAVLVQWGMKLLVDAMSGPDRAAADVWKPLIMFIGLITVENLLWRLGGWSGCRAVVKTGVDIRLDLYQHLSGHSMRYFGDHLSGSLGGRVTATATAASTLFTTLIWNILPPCTDFIGAVIVMMQVDGHIALALIVFVALVAGGITAFGILGRPLHHAYATQASRVNGEIVDLILNVWTVKAFSARNRERERLSKALGIEGDAQKRSWMYLEKARILHDLALVLMAGGILVWIINLWRGGTVTTGDVVIVSALTFRILHGSRDLALALVGTSQQFGTIAESLKVISAPHSVQDPEDGRAFYPARGTIELCDVSYAYPDGAAVFHHLDLSIPAGQKVGVVGPSGAGKSTIVALLQRMDDVQGGTILIDGQPLPSVSQDSLRERIAVVPQDIALFHRTVLENIRYGRPDATDEEVYEAARRAYCDEFVAELAQGYDTVVGERGVRLSGGQRQRLGIARAFLKDAPILILDEATSALDTHSEREIQAALTELARGRTVVAIAHRLSTVMSFDRIVVLEDGRIVEDGAPAELRRRGGIFGQLWKMQGDAAHRHQHQHSASMERSGTVQTAG